MGHEQKSAKTFDSYLLTDILKQFGQDSNARGHVDRFVIAF